MFAHVLFRGPKFCCCQGKVQLDSDLQKLCHNMAETAQMCKDNISEADPHPLSHHVGS